MSRLVPELRLRLLSEPGCYFWYPVLDSKPHPHIVLCQMNDPSPKFLVVNISSTRCDEEGPDCRCSWMDRACVLDPKDDPKNLIKRQSYVVYAKCQIVTLENIRQEFSKNEEMIEGVLGEEMFKRIHEGMFKSESTSPQFLAILRNHSTLPCPP